jgi:hypothetical protein
MEMTTMKKILLATVLACGVAMAVRAQDEGAPSDEAKDAPRTHAEEGERPARVRAPEGQRPAPVEAQLSGKIVSETRKGDDGADVIRYALETADGAKIAIGGRRAAAPEGVDLASFVGKAVTLKAQVIERKRGDTVTKTIVRVISIEAAATE